MTDLQAIVDRFDIEALRGEFTDAGTMRDHERFTSLFTRDGVWLMPHIDVELHGRDQIRAWIERAWDVWEFFVQNVHPGTIHVHGDTAVGRAYVSELGRTREGSSHLNYAVYHDRYQRSREAWKFAERRYEVRYLDTTALTGSARPARSIPT